MDVDERSLWDYRHEPEAPTTAAELSMDDSFAEDDCQDTMSDTTERGLDEENIERDERRTQGQEDIDYGRMCSLDFNGGWSESEGNTKFNTEEVAIALAPKSSNTFPLSKEEHEFNAGPFQFRKRPSSTNTSEFTFKRQFIEVDKSFTLREQLRMAKRNNHTRRDRDQCMLLKQQGAQFEKLMDQQLAAFEEKMRQQAAAHAEAAEKQIADHAAALAEIQQSAQTLIANELSKRDEIHRVAREEDSQRLEQRLEAERTKWQAQKESELAAIDQRYRKLQGVTTTTPTEKSIQPQVDHPMQPQQPYASATTTLVAKLSNAPAVPSLNYIKTIRKKHGGVTSRTALVVDEAGSHAIQGDQSSSASPETSGQPQPDPPAANMVPLSHLEPLMLRVFRTALNECNNSQGFASSKKNRRKPGRRKKDDLKLEKAEDTSEIRTTFLSATREIFKKALKYEQDEDFAMHIPALPTSVERYNRREGPGPDNTALHFDMKGGLTSEWNKKTFQFLIHKLKEHLASRTNAPERSEEYYQDLIEERFKRLLSIWRSSQARTNDTGEVETAEEVEKRVIERKDILAKSIRHTTRRVSKYDRRIKVVERVIELKTASGDPDGDLKIWKWLGELLKWYGQDGMSSEDTSVEGEETVYRVKILLWRRNIEKYLDIVDRQRIVDNDIYTKRGSKPSKRIRSGDNSISTRAPVPELPRSLYEDIWFTEVDDDYRQLTLGVSQEQFEWLNIQVR